MLSRLCPAFLLTVAFGGVVACANPAARLAAVDLTAFRAGTGFTVTTEVRNVRLTWKRSKDEDVR